MALGNRQLTGSSMYNKWSHQTKEGIAKPLLNNPKIFFDDLSGVGDFISKDLKVLMGFITCPWSCF